MKQNNAATREKILTELFRRRYNRLTQEEKLKLRDKTIGKQCDNPTLYGFVKKYSLHTLMEPKINEILDKILLNTEELTIRVARGTKVDDVIMLYMIWLMCFDSEKKEKDIWYVCDNSNYLHEEQRRLLKYIREAGIGVVRNMQKLIELDNGWIIRFLNSSRIDALKGVRDEPCLVFMDDVRLTDANPCFIECMREATGNSLFIDLCSDKYDQANISVCYSNDMMSFVNVQWFHDLSRCNGLRLERNVCGIDNIIDILPFNIEDTVGNNDYLTEMYHDGWRVKGRWLDEWERSKPEEPYPIPEDVYPYTESQLDIIESIADSVTVIVDNSNSETDEAISAVMPYFDECETKSDVQKVSDPLYCLTKPKKRIKKTEVEDEIRPYIKLFKDIIGNV